MQISSTDYGVESMIKTLIDDVNIKWFDEHYGPPICFPNTQIRKMLHLAKAGEDDVIWDLGCGWGQNLIIATTEFGVKKCIGIERLDWRYRRAVERVRERSLTNSITMIKSDSEKIIDKDNSKTKLEDATIVLYFLESDANIIKELSERLKDDCKLIYYYNALIPEIMPDSIDHPFYLSVFPFKRPISELGWLSSVTQKRNSSLVQEKQASKEELWEELLHDYEIIGLSRDDVRQYMKRLKLSK